VSEIAEDSLLSTVTQFLDEMHFHYGPPSQWAGANGGAEFCINAFRENGGYDYRVQICGYEDRRAIRFYCTWDTKIPPRRRAEIAELVARLNWDLVIGNFDFDCRDGEIRFKSTLAYEGIPLNFANLRQHFNATFSMMDLCVPWIEAVLIGEETPADAAEKSFAPPVVKD
jgi:hypothetical protein